jgi:hypothetical protein
MAATNVGQGLVEISAVSTIIGAPVAEALMHGHKAAPGLAWSPTSFFGLIHILKACIAIAIPDWARESAGLRNALVDEAIGVTFRIRTDRALKNRVDLGDAKAICNISSQGQRTGRIKRKLRAVEDGSLDDEEIEDRSTESIVMFALDKKTQLLLDTTFAAEKGEQTPVYRYKADVDGQPKAWKDWLLMLLSCIKIGEAIWLRLWGSSTLFFFTLLPWAHSFCVAVILQLLRLGRDDMRDTSVDKALGVMPTPLRLGGFGRIILGLSRNSRRHPLRRTLVGIGALVYGATLFGTFLTMGKERRRVIFVWIGFQMVWLLCRTVIYYLVESASAGRQGILTPEPWADMDADNRRRTLRMLTTISKHQISIHPRGISGYAADCSSFYDACKYLFKAKWTITNVLDDSHLEKRTVLEVATVINDNFIRSAVWFSGSIISNAEMYDAALCFFMIDANIIAVPCVRVYTCQCDLGDKGTRQRGNSHSGACPSLQWAMFVPVTSPADDTGALEWLFLSGNRMVGDKPFVRWTSREMHEKISSGYFRISMLGIADLEKALEVSRESCAVLSELLLPCRRALF